jgi:hypothetical protein
MTEEPQGNAAVAGQLERGVRLQPNGLDVRAVDPRNGAKYSPNLHRWLTMRSKKHRAWTSRVYCDESGTLWIGMLDLGDLIGARLMNVLCYGTKAESCCWVNLRGLVEVADFWPRYVRDGRCAIDPEHKGHFVGDDTRWTKDGDTRECLWCGKAQQVLVRWTEAVERQEWRTLQPNVRAKLPAEAGAVSLVRDDAPCAADQAYSACRSGSA